MTELVAGLALGLGAGIVPGPLLTLVLTSTLQRGFGAGLRVAVAPLLTDAPIIALSVAVVSSISDGMLRGLGIAGGMVVIVMGGRTIWEAGQLHGPDDATGAAGSRDLWRGILVNALSPHPWIFWLGAGGPLLVTAWRDSAARGVLFLVGFYVLLVGSKIAIAWAVARGRRRLSDRWRRRLLVAGGVFLTLGGAVLAWESAAGTL
jgi:threonine/homoserine/homoserine lactone efflux protein